MVWTAGYEDRDRVPVPRPGVLRRTAALGLAVWIVVLGLPASSRAAAPQEAASARMSPDSVELVDRVVAIVGDTAILYTEVLERLLQARADGVQIPERGTAAYDSVARGYLQEMVEQVLLLKKAEDEGVTVSPDEVSSITDQRYQQIRNGFPSATAFQAAVEQSGRTLVQYREYLRGQLRAQLMVQRLMGKVQQEKRLPPSSVSEEEVRALFDSLYSGRPRPATVTLEQVVIEPKPTQAAEDSAAGIAREALAEIRSGEDFEVVARRYSDDLSNREQGGDLGWVRRSQLVPAFAEAAWAARTGEPVGPIRTRYGYHIIKVENIRGGERKIRHILVRPALGQADFDRARQLATEVADSMRAGVPVTDLAARYGVKEAPVRIPEVPLDELGNQYGPAYAQAITDPIPGEVVGPFENRDLMPDRPLYVDVLVAEAQTGGAWKLDEQVREQIRNKLLFDKSFARFVEELRGEIYVEVRQ